MPLHLGPDRYALAAQPLCAGLTDARAGSGWSFTITRADLSSLVMCALWLYQPVSRGRGHRAGDLRGADARACTQGVDRAALLTWVRDRIFGSTEAMAVWGIFVSHKVGGLHQPGRAARARL
jgi:hypothetical protein